MKKWTNQELRILKSHVNQPGKRIKDWAHELPGRTVVAIMCRLSQMGLSLWPKKTAGKSWTFACGCSGVLPAAGESNLFAVLYKGKFSSTVCRVYKILEASKRDACKNGYKPADLGVPHSVIRDMMKNKVCYRCHESLKWVLGLGKTPHLHHNHETGEIYGFTHTHCNPRAMQKEIDELREEIKRLKQK